MNFIIKIFLILLKVLNYWFFLIPGRFTILALVCYYFLIDYIVGDQAFYLFNRQLSESWEYLPGVFWIVFGFPTLWAFISMWADTMSGPRFGDSMNSALDSAIAYRNGQMSISSPKKAFDIYRDTTHLDVMKKNSQNKTFEQAVQGFNAKYGNSSPQKIFKEFTKK